MTPQDLIEYLKSYIETCDEKGIKPSLKAVQQPSYPLMSAIRDISIDQNTNAFVIVLTEARDYTHKNHNSDLFESWKYERDLEGTDYDDE